MPKFKYLATSVTGEQVRGVVEGMTIHTVTTRLFDSGLDVQKVKERKNPLKFEITKRKVKPENVMHFSRQLAAFLRAGVPIVEAVEIVQEETNDKVLRGVLADVADGLRRGETFSASLDAHSDAFPPFFVSVLRSVELTGLLDNVLDQLSKYIERDLEARRKIKAALTYPAMIMSLSLVVVVILAGFVLPRFKGFFLSFHAKLPLPTRMLLGFTDFVTAFWWALAIGLVVGVTGVLVLFRSDFGKRLGDRIMLKAPAVGTVVKYAVIERFCRILSSMVTAGVSLPDALQLASDGTNNSVYQRGLATVREAVLQGEGISQPIARTKLFPSAITQMVRVGEATGTLDDQLESSARFYEQELEYKLKNLTGLFEPVAIVMVGLIVGFVAIALVSAMYGIFRQVKV
ncbi:MAG: type II secretion system F family protein [Acidimicrobiales bacterium]